MSDITSGDSTPESSCSKAEADSALLVPVDFFWLGLQLIKITDKNANVATIFRLFVNIGTNAGKFKENFG